MGCPHTEFRKGQRLIIRFKNGEVFIDHYVSKKSGVIILKKLKRVQVKKIKTVGIYKK
jgi:hypothetical protein